MKLDTHPDLKPDVVLIRSNTVLVTIQAAVMPDQWIIEWQMTVPRGRVNGLFRVTTTELQAMFDFIDKIPNDGISPGLCRRYEATVAADGLFIRRDQYLNILGPGTGYGGDHISIELNAEMKAAIRKKLLGE